MNKIELLEPPTPQMIEKILPPTCFIESSITDSFKGRFAEYIISIPGKYPLSNLEIINKIRTSFKFKAMTIRIKRVSSTPDPIYPF